MVNCRELCIWHKGVIDLQKILYKVGAIFLFLGHKKGPQTLHTCFRKASLTNQFGQKHFCPEFHPPCGQGRRNRHGGQPEPFVILFKLFMLNIKLGQLFKIRQKKMLLCSHKSAKVHVNTCSSSSSNFIISNLFWLCCLFVLSMFTFEGGKSKKKSSS